MRVRTLVVACVLAAGVNALCWNSVKADTIPIASGELRASDSTLTLVGDKGWWDDAVLAWSVVQNANSSFTYSYTFTETTQGTLSHMTVEVSPNFTKSEIVATSPTYKDFGIDPTSPDVDGTAFGLRGIKFDPGADGTYSASITTYRVPEWGDIFLKDGQVDAYNSGYAAPDPLAAVVPITGHITGYGWLAVPDSVVVPTPAAAVSLLGLFVTLGVMARLRRRRA